jgi:hypothetical protein
MKFLSSVYIKMIMNKLNFEKKRKRRGVVDSLNPKILRFFLYFLPPALLLNRIIIT